MYFSFFHEHKIKTEIKPKADIFKRFFANKFTWLFCKLQTVNSLHFF